MGARPVERAGNPNAVAGTAAKGTDIQLGELKLVIELFVLIARNARLRSLSISATAEPEHEVVRRCPSQSVQMPEGKKVITSMLIIIAITT